MTAKIIAIRMDIDPDVVLGPEEASEQEIVEACEAYCTDNWHVPLGLGQASVLMTVKALRSAGYRVVKP